MSTDDYEKWRDSALAQLAKELGIDPDLLHRDYNVAHSGDMSVSEGEADEVDEKK